MEHIPELLCEGFVFPETPRWHRGSFYCCSIDEGLIYRIAPDGSRTLLVQIDDLVSGFCFLDRDSEAMVISSITRKRSGTISPADSSSWGKRRFSPKKARLPPAVAWSAVSR